MKVVAIEWWVEHEFVDTKWGVRAMKIAVFKTRQEALDFWRKTPDANEPMKCEKLE